LLWRTWSFASGLPIGALCALVLLPRAAAQALAWGAVVGGALLVLVVSLLARWRDDESDRPRHLATAASAGWAAPPAAAAVLLGFAPGAWAYAIACLAALGVALFAGARAIGPSGGVARWLARALVALGLGVPATLALGALAAAAHGVGVPPLPERFRDFVLDVDASVPTRPLPACEDVPARDEVLLERGAHPSLSPDGALLWFDAPADADHGRRQIHRLERASGEIDCWSCGEPGNNTRPAAGDASLVFETDRDAGWRHPGDRDVQLAATRATGARPPSRQLTFSPDPDVRPLLGPGSRMVAWSRREAGRYQVVAASIRSGHGGVLLGEPGVLFEGGAEWVAPLAWSADGRTLVIARGNPFAPLAALALDPATGAVATLAADAAPGAAFDGDGGWLALATARGGHWAGALPSALGFALAPWAEALSGRAELRSTSGVRAGPAATSAAVGALHLPEPLAQWGEPTGIAVEPDGSGFVLGQRSADGAERLVQVSLSCRPSQTGEHAP